MHSLVISTLILSMAQQAPAPELPKYIPPLPKPALVKPELPISPAIQGIRLIPPAPVPQLSPPPTAEPWAPQPQPGHKTAVRQPKTVEKIWKAEPAAAATSHRQTFVHRLQNVSAKTAALEINHAISQKHNIPCSTRGIVIDSPLVIVPEHQTNCLIISATPEYVKQIRKLLESVDEPPKQFRIQAVIKTTDSDGNQQIVARPRLITLEGNPAIVRIADADGSSIELQVDVLELTTEPHKDLNVKKASAGSYRPDLKPAIAPGLHITGIRKPYSHSLYRALSASRISLENDKPRQPTQSEKEIQQALEKHISLQFADAPLIDVIKHISKTTDINVALDHRGLEEAGLTSKAKVNVDVDGVTLKSALRLILEPLGLGCKIEDEVLKITSKSRAEGPLKTVTYPVADLVIPPAGEKSALSFDALIDLITSLVEPDSWSQRGGEGAISSFETTLSLVIRQTDRGHEKIKTLLEGLRKVNAADE